MSNELELWQFISSRLSKRLTVMLLVVAESSGSSPGRAGYKMAVATDGGLCGSIGGGVMEVRLVEQAKELLSKPPAEAGQLPAVLIEQEHRKNSQHPSGMICSGRQTVILRQLTSAESETVKSIIETLTEQRHAEFEISNLRFQIAESKPYGRRHFFSKTSETDFAYREKLGAGNELFIIGGGHCALALSELMSKMDFHISIFDDRPELNTIEKNRFADTIKIIDGYEQIGELITEGASVYVVVMTLGYRSDELVIRKIIDTEFKYFGVLGSKAKMKTLLAALAKEGVSKERLDRIHTPIGLPIKSHTPEEIAVSIAAEIISVKNS